MWARGRGPVAGGIASLLSSRTSYREQVEAEAGEGDHHREHPVLGAGGAAVVAPVYEGAVVGEGQADDVADEERRDLDVPDDVRGQGAEVDAVFGGAEEVGRRGAQGVGE